MSTNTFESLHPRSQDSGKFETKTHADPGVSLGAAPDPEATVSHVLHALGLDEGSASVYAREKKHELAAGETSTAAVFGEMVAGNRKGKCRRHEYNASDTALFCLDCRIALATETALNRGRSLPVNVPDPERTVDQIFSALDTDYSSVSAYLRERKRSLAAGESTVAEILAELAANNSNGKCQRHEHNHGITASYCDGCLLALATEAAINPRPAPVPLGDRPRPGGGHVVEPGVTLSEYRDEEFGTSTTKKTMTGDESFEAAIRKMLGAPADAKVTVTDETTESGDYTKEYYTEITVEAGGISTSFDGLGALMRKLDEKDENGPTEMAMRLMQATDARRPLLSGPAAIYLKKDLYNGAEPMFAHVTQVFKSMQEPQIRLLHLDGREEYIHAASIAAITETDQTTIYEEKP